MKKAELAVLERAFNAEVSAAMSHGLPVLQTRSKVAKRLMDEGYLAWHSIQLDGWPPVTVSGYVLTHAGRLEYCLSCEGEQEPTR